MKHIICLLLVGIVTFGTFGPYRVDASTGVNNATQIEMLQKLLLELQAQLSLISQPTSTKQTASLRYERKTNNIDKAVNQYGVSFYYEGSATCNTLKPDYKVSFGDGKSVMADCKGVADHVYKKHGSYTAKYTDKGKVVAKVKVVIDKKVTEADSSLEDINTANPIAVLRTNKGIIEIELFADTMPVTVGNFKKLIKEKFYDGIKFHRVIDGFMIQGGDPLTKDDSKMNMWGTGGPGYAIADEHVEGSLLTNTRGTISMANSGPNSGGSQFFINLVDNSNLDFNKPPFSSAHPVFGRVIAGMDVVDAIGKVKVIPGNNRPVDAVVITKASIK